MKLRAQIANFISGGEVVRQRRAAIVSKKQARVKAKAGNELLQGRYEAAFWNLKRSYLPEYIQGAREDINSLSRLEILRRIRYFEKNSNVLGKILTTLDVNVIGPGITPTPITSNAPWNTAAKKWFYDWAKVADACGQTTLWQDQSIVYRGQNVDGDHALELKLNAWGRPVISLIEGHRIGSAITNEQGLDKKGLKIVDGVVVDTATGRPSAYIVANEFDSGKTETIQASNLVLFFKKKRAGQYRGITRFHAAILDLHDLDDLQSFEMQAAKKAGATTDYLKTSQGSVSPSDVLIGGSMQKGTKSSAADRDKYYAQIQVGETKVLFPGDEVIQGKNERPTAATTGFWDKLDKKIVQGGGISYGALVDYEGTLGGATLRAVIQGDSRIYELETLEQANGWQRVWEFAVGWAMDHNELPKNPEFRNVRWHPPRRTSVDLGHDTKALLSMMQAGLSTNQDVWGEMGEDWEERFEQRAKEEKFIDDIAKKYGISRHLISSFAQERMSGLLPGTEPDASGSEASTKETPPKATA